MTKYLTIGELAKLREISTDTLRYYDKIGLLKPSYTNPDNNRRYYSMDDTAGLFIIKELQEVGMSLNEIQEYIHSRTPEKTVLLLTEFEKNIEKRLAHLRSHRKSIRSRKRQLQNTLENILTDKVVLKAFPERYFLVQNANPVRNRDDVFYHAFILNRELNESGMIFPVFATSNYAGITRQQDVKENRILTYLAFQIDENLEFYTDSLETVPPGNFLCLQVNTVFWENQVSIQQLMNYIDSNGYELIGDVIQIIQIDDSVVTSDADIVYEFQAPVQKIQT